MIASLGSPACSDPSDTPLAASLSEFGRAAKRSVDDVVTVCNNLLALQAAIDATDDKAFDDVLDRQGALLDEAQRSLDQLGAAEAAIEAALAADRQAGSLRQALGAKVGFIATLHGLIEYASELRNLSKQMSEHRAKREQALVDIGNGVDGAQKRHDESNGQMYKTGRQAITVMVKKVSTDMTTSPLSLKRRGGVVFKELAGRAYGRGLDVIAGTKGCETDPAGESCVVSLARTDDSGRVQLPVGDNNIALSGGGAARRRFDGIDVSASEDIELLGARVPIGTATPEQLRGDGAVSNRADAGGGSSDSYYILCQRANGPGLMDGSTWSCLTYDGNPEELTSTIGEAFCKQSGYQSLGGYNGRSFEQCDKVCQDYALLLAAHRCAG